MSNPNPFETSSHIDPSEQASIQAEWIATSTTTDYAVTDSQLTGSGLLSLKNSQNLDYASEELTATDAIAFNFFPAANSTPSPSPQATDPGRNPFDVLLTPWGLGGFCCLLLANGLLTLSVLTPAKITTPVTSSLTSATSAPIQSSSSILNLAAPPAQNLGLTNLSELSPVAKKTPVIPAYQAIAALNTQNLPPAPVTYAPQTTAPALVVRESLTELLLPPSLQPQANYSAALPPVTPQLARPLSVRANPLTPKPRAVQLAPVTVQPANLPTIAVPPAYTHQMPPVAPQLPAQYSAPLPPPPVSQPTAILNPTAPPVGNVSNRSLPATINNPNNPNIVIDNSSTDTQSSSASEQTLQQILNQQNQLELSKQQANNFNQKIQQRLRSLPNQNQGLTVAPSQTGTQGLVEQLQQLNQPE